MPFCYLSKILKSVCLFFILLTFIELTADDDSKWRFSTKETVVSVGDIHGAFDNLVNIMQKAELLDKDNYWIGGKTHFVSTGDILDRGPDSRKVLNLLMKLEKQAIEAGGKVHVLLGNHEVMNLIGDRRYISKEEYAAFIPEEPSDLRAKQFKKFLSEENLTSDPVSLALFTKRFPPGYFGLHLAFKANGYYGRWLNEKPLMIVINDKIMVHSGLSSSTGKMGLAGVNTDLISDMKTYATLWYWLVDFGYFSYDLPKKDRIIQARKLVNGEVKDNQFNNSVVVTKAEQFLKVAESTILNSQESPTWYRGSVLCHQFSEQPLFDKVLKQIGANSVFVGHTNTYTHEAESRFNKRLFMQDTGMLTSVYKGQSSLLFHKNKSVKVFDADHGLHEIEPQSLKNWKHPYGMTNTELEEFLLTAEIINSTLMKSHTIYSEDTVLQKLSLQKDNKKIDAIFYSSDSHPSFEKKKSVSAKKSKTNRYHNEIAAYQLDKMLSLDMVPPSVEITIEGKTGLIQYWPGKSYYLRDMIDNNIGYGGHCSQNSQLFLMKIFDRLIFNEGRNPGNLLFNKKDWNLWLLGNSRAFRVTRLKSYKMKWKDITLSPKFRNKLTALNKNALYNSLKPYLNKKQIDYILKRRDEILKYIK
ncbi:MAG: hypothetical protein GY808_08500 [Gammaproteobacteria bacterium]|nr:hypothetical protein [Gammaproteobacteria bacterium]